LSLRAELGEAIGFGYGEEIDTRRDLGVWVTIHWGLKWEIARLVVYCL